jgi:hypothetical protein
MSFDRGSPRHHGAESSALKNSAPSSLTIFKTSESTSISREPHINWVFAPRILDARSNIQDLARLFFTECEEFR